MLQNLSLERGTKGAFLPTGLLHRLVSNLKSLEGYLKKKKTTVALTFPHKDCRDFGVPGS